MTSCRTQKCRNSISSHAPHVQPATGYSSPESPDSADGNPILHPKPHAIACGGGTAIRALPTPFITMFREKRRPLYPWITRIPPRRSYLTQPVMPCPIAVCTSIASICRYAPDHAHLQGPLCGPVAVGRDVIARGGSPLAPPSNVRANFAGVMAAQLDRITGRGA